ncbi:MULTISPECIES: hypothetical protein [Moraxella]|uniref:Uncharacterized protein n=2 Tax=Moraxella TaxID=475 RepID=A0A1B8QJ47_MORNO|nr:MULTISPECIES: hypothetical protein [Moraxella]OBX83508.1 hypothetical protein A7456_05725 [Moraxella nonliquefaciens]OPH38454.1 hypothetical protein B5J94_03275 [Moraxella lacunata]QPT44036.1 hypothetical protein I6G26_08150 [Moraxella nonliquefaciens]QQC29055.1 hypothetical protein I6H63_06935 [Moraxella nonliquefaciens]
MTDTFSPEILKEQYHLTNNEAHELSDLLKFFENKNFTYSKQLSDFIVKNNLADRFPNLTGVGLFKKGSDEWNLKGAISPSVYHIVCSCLNLQGKDSGSTIHKFTSYKSTKNNSYPNQSLFESLERFFVDKKSYDDEKYSIEDLVELYGENPSEMTSSEMELFLET